MKKDVVLLILGPGIHKKCKILFYMSPEFVWSVLAVLTWLAFVGRGPSTRLLAFILWVAAGFWAFLLIIAAAEVQLTAMPNTQAVTAPVKP